MPKPIPPHAGRPAIPPENLGEPHAQLREAAGKLFFQTTLLEIKLPAGARFGAIVRGEGRQSQVLMPHHDTLIEADDHIIIFIPHKRLIRAVEKLFQVGATFFG